MEYPLCKSCKRRLYPKDRCRIFAEGIREFYFSSSLYDATCTTYSINDVICHKCRLKVRKEKALIVKKWSREDQGNMVVAQSNQGINDIDETINPESLVDTGPQTNQNRDVEAMTINNMVQGNSAEIGDILNVSLNNQNSQKDIQATNVSDSLSLDSAESMQLSLQTNEVLGVDTNNDISASSFKASLCQGSSDYPETLGSISSMGCNHNSELDSHISNLTVNTPEFSQSSGHHSEFACSSTSSLQSLSSSSTVFLKEICRCPSTQRKCMLCNCAESGRKVVSEKQRLDAFIKTNVIIPEGNRICAEGHIENGVFTSRALERLRFIGDIKGVYVNSSDLGKFILGLTNISPSGVASANFDESITEEKCHFLTGLNKDQFKDLFDFISPHLRNSCNRSKKNAVAIYLSLLRLGVSQEILGFIYGTTQAIVSHAIESVSNVINVHFVPLHLGLKHISRDELIQKHSRPLYNALYGRPEGTLFLTVDGTYLYVETPANFTEQRQLYSVQKGKCLVKPMMAVMPDGYILDAFGTFIAKNNDASIMNYLLHPSTDIEEHRLGHFLDQGDVLIEDRGFRDSKQTAEDLGLYVHMPVCLQKTANPKTFSAEKANDSRRETLTRWLVELINGRIKNVFSFFSRTIPGGYKGRLSVHFRNACALMNAFYPPVQSVKRAQKISSLTDDDFAKPNSLKVVVETNGWNKAHKLGIKASADQVINFPKLTLEELEDINLGTYGVKLALNYINEHLDAHGEFEIYVHSEQPDILAARIHSRFSGTTIHKSWVQFVPDGIGCESITGWYCLCKTGERTLGCCVHVMAILRYFSFQRYQDNQKLRTRRKSDAMDAAQALKRFRES